jgi:hypothetical protein
MANAQMNGLFVLPTELRLEVYRLLFEECLADGYVSDVAGLFLCCREVHRELEAEFMTRVRPLLEIMYKWAATELYDEPLCILVKPRSARNMPASGLSVILPALTHQINDEVI